jgi:hypothetical protein
MCESLTAVYSQSAQTLPVHTRTRPPVRYFFDSFDRTVGKYYILALQKPISNSVMVFVLQKLDLYFTKALVLFLYVELGVEIKSAFDPFPNSGSAFDIKRQDQDPYKNRYEQDALVFAWAENLTR